MLNFVKINKKDLAAGQATQLAFDFQSFDPEKLSLYSCEDADFTNRLVKILEKNYQNLSCLNLVYMFRK